MKPHPKLESVYSEARWPLTASDKYVIRIIWKRYTKLYKQHQQGKLKVGEYATRRRNYLNLIYDIMGFFSVPTPQLRLEYPVIKKEKIKDILFQIKSEDPYCGIEGEEQAIEDLVAYLKENDIDVE